MNNSQQPAVSPIPPTSSTLSVAYTCSYGFTIHSLEMTFASDCDNEIPQSATKSKGVVLADTMEDYVRIINEDKGPEAAIEAIYTFLGAMERKEIMIYCIEEIPVDRMTYARYPYNDILITDAQKDLINPLDMIEEQEMADIPGSSTEQDVTDTKESLDEGMDEQTWEELIAQLSWTKEEEIAQYELLLAQNYQQYKELLEINAKNLLDRNTLSYQLAQNVTAWAHLKFNRPVPTDQRSDNQYLSEKHRSLKQIMPDVTGHRTLTQKMKFVDHWGKFNYTIGIDPSATWGSVAPQNDFWNAEEKSAYTSVELKLISREEVIELDDEGNEITSFEIETVINHRGPPKNREYLVRWKNYSSKPYTSPKNIKHKNSPFSSDALKVAPPGPISSIMDTINSDDEENLTVAELPNSKAQQTKKRSQSHTSPLRRSKRMRC
ncbi:unnamed protein product [Rhizopus stolonifer]